MASNLAYTFLILIACTLSAISGLEQCPELHSPIKFYKGQPGGDVDLKAFAGVFEQLFSSLGKAFESFKTSANQTDGGPIFNYTEFFASMNFTYPQGNETFGFLSDSAPGSDSVAPVSGSTTVGPPVDGSTTPAPSKGFDLGHFLKNLLPVGNMTGPAGSKEAPAPQGLGSFGKIFGAGPAVGVGPAGVFKGPGQDQILKNNASETTDDWGITVPLNVLRIEAASLNESQGATAAFGLSGADLKGNRSHRDYKKFVQHVDLSGLGVRADAFYLVCLTMIISQNDERTECRRCSLLKACASSECTKSQSILSFQAPSSKVHPYDARLHFFVYDYLPSSGDIVLVTRVVPKSVDSRCPRRPLGGALLAGLEGQQRSAEPRSSPARTAEAPASFDKFERADRLHPASVLYVSVPNLSPREAYAVEGDLLVHFPTNGTTGNSAGPPFDWASPVLVANYFGTPQQEYLIGACGRPV